MKTTEHIDDITDNCDYLNWFLVKLPFSKIGGGYDIILMDRWISEYMKNSNVRYNDNATSEERYYYIEYEEDAVAFKLRWL